MSRFFAIVPAAGGGSRMGAERPKQYLDLLGRPMIWHALAALVQVPRLAVVYVVLAPEDLWWDRFDWSDFGERLQVLRMGGATRAMSVSNALGALAQQISPQDWVLVHDAARACVQAEHVDCMLDVLQADPVGGLLAVPVADTLKRQTGDGRVECTVARDGLWQAQTPQMFRYNLLVRALAESADVTDEAGAIEALGLVPRLVAAEASNFKITYPQDLALAAHILLARSCA